MSSNPETSNLLPVNEADKADWPTIGCRIRPSDKHFIDLAVLEVRKQRGLHTYTRSDFLAEAAVEKAITALGRVPEEAAA